MIGAGVVGPGSAPYEAAYEVAAGLARAGLVIVCGGRTGVMEAACKGAADAGGIAIGILPGLDLAEANPYATILLPTDLGSLRNPVSTEPDVSRNRVIASCGVCVVACGGGPGTANEIKHALQFDKTVFAIAGAPEPEAPAASDPRPLRGRVVRLETPADAVARVLELVATSRRADDRVLEATTRPLDPTGGTA